MQLPTEFIQLPLTFDAARLAAEIEAIDESEWRPHPEGHPGNSAVPLIAVDGNPRNDAVRGVMLPTPILDRLPYVRQVLAAFHAVWGRTRLMRLDGNAEAVAHTDTNYYWAQHTRVHVPIVTDPDVQFLCGDASVHMAAGQSWIFDTWRRHNVLNPNPTRRIHLVADTVGSAAFWELVDRGAAGAAPEHVPYSPLRSVPLSTESVNHPVVMQPAEQAEMIALVAGAMNGAATGAASEAEAQLLRVLEVLRRDWRSAWARFGPRRDGWPLYRQLLRRATAESDPLRGRIRLGNGIDAIDAVTSLVFRPALAADEESGAMPSRAPRISRHVEQPVFIVCAPRSGSTLFFETLSQSPSLWTVGGESHSVIEGMPSLHPASRRYHSNRLTAADATPEIVEELEERFRRQLRDRDGRPPARNARALRLLEKTPKNALRVPFLAAAFPDATFVYLYRDIRDTISSMLDAWRSGKFVTYPALPGWTEPPWSLLLTPGWRELAGKPLAEIVAAQWSTSTRYLLDDLEQLPPRRWCVSRYDALLNDPQQEMQRLSRFLGIDWDRMLASPLPHSRTTLTAPDPEKWKRNAGDLAIAMPLVAEVAARADALFA
ncbi:MAG TPA: sulfotransferase [Thermoanaerobaculia bacterium]|nr:sulfotransferase [Thermoanaerobaculia bacterium]